MGWSFIASTLSVSDDEDEHEERGEPDPSRHAQTCGIGIGPKNIRSTFSLPITRTSSCVVQYITISTSRMIWIAQKCGHTISAINFSLSATQPAAIRQKSLRRST